MPASTDKIHKILKSEEFDDADKAVVKWQFRLYGDFYTALWEAISRADDENLARLRMGFPNEVTGYLRWTRGDLGDRLREAGLDA